MEHGSVIAYLCYEKKVKSDEDTKFFRVGALLYYRSHQDHVSPTVQVRMDLFPDEALQFEFEFFIGNFIPSEKVPEPPFIDGDLFATTEERGMPCFICGNRFALGHETAGHHILYRSTHPEYATEEMNVVPLCSNCHIPIAHEQAEKFIEFLEKKDPARYAWYVEHNHHKIKKRGT